MPPVVHDQNNNDLIFHLCPNLHSNFINSFIQCCSIVGLWSKMRVFTQNNSKLGWNHRYQTKTVIVLSVSLMQRILQLQLKHLIVHYVIFGWTLNGIFCGDSGFQINAYDWKSDKSVRISNMNIIWTLSLFSTVVLQPQNLVQMIVTSNKLW